MIGVADSDTYSDADVGEYYNGGAQKYLIAQLC